MILINFVFNKKLSDWGLYRQVFEQKRMKQIQESLRGIINNKIFNLNIKLSELFNRFTEKSIIYAFYVNIFQQISKLWFEFFIVLIVFVIFCINIFIYKVGINELITTLGLYVVVAVRLIPIISKSIGNFQNLNYYKAPADITQKYLNLENEIKFNKDYFNFKNQIKFEDVSFNYQNKSIIKNVNLEINKGDFLGIFGDSGSGKTTFVNLITSLLLPSKGNIQIDGNLLKENSFDWIKKIGYVPQKVFLYDDTVKNNICIDVDKINHNKIKEVLKLAELEDQDHFINKNVGDGGSNVSGGQAQRIGIARALYKSPSILILDEPTAGLDEKTEFRIMKTLINLSKKITIILVTHNLKNLRMCNKIYHIENHSIKERKNDKNF